MTLSPESAERITLLYRAAKRNGSLVSVEELSRLLPESASKSEVENAIETIPLLSTMFELRSGYLTERVGITGVDPLELEARSRGTAWSNLSHAARFVSYLHTSGFETVAVSGSTSYGSASVSKDTDLFCVAPAGRMWFSLVKGLIMARAYALLNRKAAGVCLSCVMDADYARSTFETRRHPLFARDAIQAKVLVGRERYSSLMRSAGWISDYYPVAYEASLTERPAPPAGGAPSALTRILNRALFVVVGGYVQAKSSLLNRRLRARGRRGDLFVVRLGGDHLIYESRRYLDLRKEYEAADRVPRSLPAPVTS